MSRSWREKGVAKRTSRRELELIAIVTDRGSRLGLSIAATISSAEGMRREVFEADETPAGLVAAIREVADWLERDYVEKPKEATAA